MTTLLLGALLGAGISLIIGYFFFNTLSHKFKSISADALQQNNQSFLDLAKTQIDRLQVVAEQNLQKREQSIEQMVKPVRESLDKVTEKMGVLEKERVGAYESLKQQLTQLGETERILRSETSNLVAALRAPQARGRWGEIQLKRVVEMAGMLEHCDFMQQSSELNTSSDTRMRPDLIVKLPGGKNIVVDAKTPLASYLDAAQENDPVRKLQKLKEHALHVKSHIQQLSRKSYWDQFQPTPEFVVLFLTSDAIFGAALEQEPSLIETGVAQNVIIATPTTLIALLRAVAFGWRQENLAKNAQAIGALGKELYKRLCDMTEHFDKVGKGLNAATNSYNQTLRSLESRVLVSARRFKNLDGGVAAELPELPPISATAMEVTIPTDAGK